MMGPKNPKVSKVDGGHSVRLSFGDGKRASFTMPLEREAAAIARAEKLVALAALLSKAGRSTEAPLILRKAAGAQTDAGFRAAQAKAEELCGRPVGSGGKAKVPTLREIGESWTSGKMHRENPDRVRAKKTGKDDVSRLELYVYPMLGNKAVTQVTLADCEAVMKALPESVSRSRAHIASLMVILLRLAVFPLRAIERSPLPEGFVPKRPKRKALAYLYPDEDRRLMACTGVPLQYRLLWGFLTREGMREGEALALEWQDVDMKRGLVRLDKNKTDDPRAWALSPGTAAALSAYRARSGKTSGLVFVTPTGSAHSKFGLADTMREHLKLIELDQERPELFETTAERQRIRVHDLRGTFVTLALAAGRSEAWISDRTGHRSSLMINRYKRTARSFQELGLGELAPLVAAIPELDTGSRTGSNEAKLSESFASPTGFEPVLQP